MSSSLVAREMEFFSFCRPSRAPTSTILTWSARVCRVLEKERMVEEGRRGRKVLRRRRRCVGTFMMADGLCSCDVAVYKSEEEERKCPRCCFSCSVMPHDSTHLGCRFLQLGERLFAGRLRGRQKEGVHERRPTWLGL